MTFNLDILARVDAALGEALETAKTVQALIGDFDAKSAKLALGSLPEHARPPPAEPDAAQAEAQMDGLVARSGAG